MLTVLRWILFGCSTVGFWEILRRRSTLHPSFLPVITVACQCCVLLAAGLLNVLREAAYLMGAVGLAAGIVYTVSEKGKNLKYYGRMEFLFLAVSMGVLFFCLRGKVFTHYDNFSHWALVIRTMLRNNRFPGFEDPIITYRGYPLGSSVFVYYTAKLVGEAEPIQMMGQAYAMLTCMLPLFHFRGRSRWPVFILILFAANFFLSYNVQPTELLVDSLLPLAGMCALLFALSCRKDKKRDGLLMTLLLIWVLQIKNAGVFFALAAGGVWLYSARRCGRLRPAAICVGAAFASLYLWNRHCKYVFGADGTARHFLSASWWEIALGSKTTEDIKHIALELARRAFQWEYFGVVLILVAAVTLFCLFFTSIRKKSLLRFAAGCVLLFLAWQGALFLTYVFSMTRDEAFFLVSFDRYEKTVMLAIAYLAVALAVRTVSEADRIRIPQAAATAALSAALCLLACRYGDTWSPLIYRPYRIGEYDGLEVRTWMETLKTEYDIPDLPGDGTFYAFLIEGWDSDYFYYMGTYVFSGTDITVYENADQEALNRINAKYVLIHDRENPIIHQWVQEHAQDQAGNDVIQLRE